MFEYKRKFFWSFKGFVFCWRMIFVWGLWLWSKGSSSMDFWWEKKFFGRLEVLFFVDIWFSFEVYGCGVKVCLLLDFWWKRKTFLGFHGLVFCLGFLCLNIFVSLVYGVEKDGLWTYFENVFLLNEWWMDGLVGFSWIVCWHEFVVLFKSFESSNMHGWKRSYCEWWTI